MEIGKESGNYHMNLKAFSLPPSTELPELLNAWRLSLPVLLSLIHIYRHVTLPMRMYINI